MKTRILTLTMIALMMGLVMNSRADNTDTNRTTSPVIDKTFQASINLFPGNIVKFHVVKAEQDKVKLRIYDESGIVLYTYLLKKENTARIGFDVSTMKAGKYDYVIVRNKKEVIRKTIIKKD